MLNFHNIRFPVEISFGAIIHLDRRVETVRFRGGGEALNFPCQMSSRRYQFSIGSGNIDQLSNISAFFDARQGGRFAFRWKDWSDYKSCKVVGTPHWNDQIIGFGDGKKQEFQLLKKYGDLDYLETRNIHLPVLNTLQVARDNTPLVMDIDYQIVENTGLIRFTEPPESGAQISAGFEFDVPVRFTTSQLSLILSAQKYGEIAEMEVKEVLLD